MCSTGRIFAFYWFYVFFTLMTSFTSCYHTTEIWFNGRYDVFMCIYILKRLL